MLFTVCRAAGCHCNAAICNSAAHGSFVKAMGISLLLQICGSAGAQQAELGGRNGGRQVRFPNCGSRISTRLGQASFL